MALLATLLCHAQYVPLTDLGAFTAAGTAGLPFFPWSENACLRHFGRASPGLLKISIASYAASLRLIDYVAVPISLATKFSRGKIRAVTPWAPFRHPTIHCPGAARVTALCFQQRSIAWRAALIVHLSDDPLSFAQTHARRLGPFSPSAKDTVFGNAVDLALLGQRALLHCELRSEAVGMLVTFE